jgi:hypothetical protein
MTIPQAGITAVAVLWLLAVGAVIAKVFGLLAGLSWWWMVGAAVPAIALAAIIAFFMLCLARID